MARLFSSAAVLLAAALTGLASAVPYTPRLRTAQFMGRHLQEQCVPSLEWTSEGGEILVNGQPFHLKGTSVRDRALRGSIDRPHSLPIPNQLTVSSSPLHTTHASTPTGRTQTTGTSW